MVRENGTSFYSVLWIARLYLESDSADHHLTEEEIARLQGIRLIYKERKGTQTVSDAKA